MAKREIDLIALFLGIVFLSAAAFRVLNYRAGIEEFTQLNLPLFLLNFTIIFEILVGILFLTNKKVFLASLATIIFLTIAITLAFVHHGSEIIRNIPELFVFNPTPTDIFLHLMFILLLVLLINKKSRK